VWAGAVAFLKGLPAEVAAPLVAATGAFSGAGALAFYWLRGLLRRRIVRARVLALIGRGESLLNPPRTDHASQARAIDEWRAEIGGLPHAVRHHVLHDTAVGDWITLALQRLREVSRDLPRWLDL